MAFRQFLAAVSHPATYLVRSAWSGSYKVLQEQAASVVPMGGMKSVIIALIVGVTLTSTACAPNLGGEAAANGQASVAVAPQTLPIEERASRIAQGLADAEGAFDREESARLGELVNTLYASGVAPFEGAQTDLLSKWASASGAEQMPYRGRLLGPAYVRGELAPGETWKSAQTFKSGVPSTLAVSHKGSGPVSISVSDQRSRRVCNTDRSTLPSCRFTPMYTQRYSIELVNEGSARAVYFLVFD